MGGYYNRKFTSDVLVIDCGSNTVRHFCVMPKVVNDSVANVIDAKIYVVGGHYRDTENGSWSSNRMMVLERETQTWECGEENYGLEAGCRLISEEKIYIIKGDENNFVFNPREGRWEIGTDKRLHSSWKGNTGPGCIIDGIFYSYDTCNNCLSAYDLKHRLPCGVVKGVEGLVKGCKEACVASCGEKLMILLMQDGNEIWGAEISLSQVNPVVGEIWGKVEWCQLLLRGLGYFSNCLTVVV
ncbi:hypothetical protein F2Q69_00058090 [Brassica cretica]|uniref:FKB95-like N-terminal Kelch domain-containing protein n=1 Tax=Brassica cretica TaxID=69181 RepID=A0A8S9RM15_BRACR|nr:hypothetical protein F2Q69_00058090 [Brassica cretica]